MAELTQTRTRARFTPRALVLMAVVAACVCGGGLRYLSSVGSDGSAARHGPSGRGPIDGIPATQAKTYGVQGFDVMQGPAERLPTTVRAQITVALGPHSEEVQPFRAQHMTTRAGGIWLVGGREQTCLVKAGGGVTCAINHLVRRYGLAVGVGKPPAQPGGKPHNFLLVGVAPDAFHRVLLRIGSSIQEVAVRHHVYTHRASVPIVVDRLEP